MRLIDALRPADVAIFHEFQRPPYGGGNQFLLALCGELERGGLRVATNRIPRSARSCLFNSFNFDFDRLRAARRSSCRMVHRVDGPIGTYRGEGQDVDRRLAALNAELADATVLQSRYSLDAHRELGIELREPHVIMNAVDPSIFHPPPSSRARAPKLRIISTSWSANPNKGGDAYAWLDRNLDHSRYEYTFVGRVPVAFEHIRLLPPVASRPLAELLREHDVYLTASLHDPCSNALLEGLACGLPAVYARSGGHPEIVGDAGRGFDRVEEIPVLLELLARELDDRRNAISIPSLDDTTARYRAVLGVA